LANKLSQHARFFILLIEGLLIMYLCVAFKLFVNTQTSCLFLEVEVLCFDAFHVLNLLPKAESPAIQLPAWAVEGSSMEQCLLSPKASSA